MSIRALIEGLRGCPEQTRDEEVRLWYGWLFEGTCADIDIPLWESAYEGEGRVLLNDITLEVVRCYLSEHLFSGRPDIPADEIGIELEFFLRLLNQEAYEKAADFFRQHLKALWEHVFTRVLKESGCGFYTQFARDALQLLHDTERRAEAPGQLASLRTALPEQTFLRSVTDEQVRELLQVRHVHTAGRSNCGGKCELEADTAAGCVLDVHACRREDPLTLPPCAKGRAYRGTYLHSARLRYPMLRVGNRGEGRFRRISWQQAVELIHERLTTLTRQYGPGCRYVNYSSGVTSQISGDFVLRRMLGRTGGYLGLFNSYSSACISYTLPYVFGTAMTGSSLASFADTNLAIFWGNNPLVTEYCEEWIRLLQAFRDRKTRVILIDPHYNETGRMLHADWIPIRPDTDAALAAALAYVLWDEHLQNQDFMDTYCLGFDAAHMPEGMEEEESYHDYVFGVRDGVVKDPAWAEGITGIPAERIRRLAREYAGAAPGAIFAGRGCQRNASGEQNIRSIALLACMTGYVGQTGGGTGCNFYLPQHKAPAYAFGENPYRGRIPSFLWTQAILDGRNMTRREHHIMGREQLESDIKILFSLAGNTMLNQHSDSNRTAAILRDTSKCEFIVVSDLFMTASARYADLLLPGTSMFEDAYISAPWGEGDYLLYADQVIKPLFESRFEVDWILELEKMLGAEGTAEGAADAASWYRSLYERIRPDEPELPSYETFCRNGGYRYRNNPVHIAFEQEIRDPANHPFPTESGRIEIFSRKLKAWEDPDIPAIPKYLGAFEGVTDPLKERYSLQLIGWHTKRRCHSIGDNNRELEKLEPHRVWIHPSDAAARGITEDSETEVYNDRGIVRIKAHVTDEIMQGVICIPQGAWYTPDASGTDIRGCVNTLTTQQPTALAKANPQHSCLAEIRTADSGRERRS